MLKLDTYALDGSRKPHKSFRAISHVNHHERFGSKKWDQEKQIENQQSKFLACGLIPAVIQGAAGLLTIAEDS